MMMIETPGYPLSEDLNGYQQEGVGHMDSTVHKGMRWSAASAYLRPALQRSNLTTENNVMVTKIIIEGKRAVGIEVIQKGTVKKYGAGDNFFVHKTGSVCHFCLQMRLYSVEALSTLPSC